MALPDNDHHVHSPGYTSEQGDPDRMRMMEEVADEIEPHNAVSDVYADEDIGGPYVEVEYDGEHETLTDVEDVADDYGCGVTSLNPNRGWLEVRPA
jgi:hypothetical protein